MRVLATLGVFLVAGLVGCSQDGKAVIPTNVAPMPTEAPRALGETPFAPAAPPVAEK